ncbi:outer membrane protein [Bartonella sp. A05]|uniref:outer membrane protein n=1 Tax=Bartonella sp. A05 TaxID=2967261 RepID=UPI0022A9F183|nr:outer membrane beta-barrel protein [Bartonella sp. A05]MCZ2203358.1 outer membrane beta-barrel protein [Bartonella sp. A05]
MNMKYLMAVSVAAVISVSAAQAADTILREGVPSEALSSQEGVPSEVLSSREVPSEALSSVVGSVVATVEQPVLAAPDFSWTGVYVGGQIGWAFSDIKEVENKSAGELKKSSDSISGLISGLYAGYNFDLSESLVLGVDTDITFSADLDSKKWKPEAKTVDSLALAPAIKEKLDELKLDVKGETLEEGDKITLGGSSTVKENWGGATRLVVGYALDRMMPYVAGGIAYGQIQDKALVSMSLEKKNPGKDEAPVPSKKDSAIAWDDVDTLVGYTVGGGVAYAVTNDIVARVEYRYTDYTGFGKLKLGKDVSGKLEHETSVLDIKSKSENSYTNHVLRVGVAYKF